MSSRGMSAMVPTSAPSKGLVTVMRPAVAIGSSVMPIYSNLDHAETNIGFEASNRER